MAGIGSRVPIWITENGVPTGVLSATPSRRPRCASSSRAVHDYSRTFGITDYRWFNLRDSVSTGPETLSGLTFAIRRAAARRLRAQAVLRRVPAL